MTPQLQSTTINSEGSIPFQPYLLQYGTSLLRVRRPTCLFVQLCTMRFMDVFLYFLLESEMCGLYQSKNLVSPRQFNYLFICLFIYFLLNTSHSHSSHYCWGSCVVNSYSVRALMSTLKRPQRKHTHKG